MKLPKITGLFVLLIALTYCKKEEDLQSTVNQNSTLSEAYTKRLNVVLDSACKALQIKGASATVLVPNVGIWNKAYGESHQGVPISTNMSMTIGSNTKTYIATLILKLQEQGVLNINDTIGKWIKNKPYTNGKVTIKQLLNHTSGFGDFSYNPDFIEAIQSDFNRIWKPEEMYQLFEAPLFTPPGSRYEYSDQNLVLAGLIIQEVTKKPVEKSLRELILKPANLPNTVYYPFETNNLAIPHSWSADYSADGSLEDLDATYGYTRKAFCSADNAAGGMMSTAEENARFWRDLFNGRIISQQSLNLMTTVVEFSPNNGYGLCIGKAVNGYNGRTGFYHAGYVPGSISNNVYDPISGVSIVILTNQDKVRDLDPILIALHKVTLQYAK